MRLVAIWPLLGARICARARVIRRRIRPRLLSEEEEEERPAVTVCLQSVGQTVPIKFQCFAARSGNWRELLPTESARICARNTQSHCQADTLTSDPTTEAQEAVL